MKPITRADFDAALAEFDDPDESGFLDALDVLGYDTAIIRVELKVEEEARQEAGRRYLEERRAKMTPQQREIDDRMSGAISSLGDLISDDFFRSSPLIKSLPRDQHD